MEEIKKAKEKAEKYLHNVVNKSWNNLVNVEKDENIPEGWPIQLEAHVYLGRKYKNLIPNFTHKIRHLWLNWANRYENKEHKYEKYKFFWPAIDNFLIPINLENAESDVGHEIECHMGMFRAKENLKIIGFDSYFNEAKRRLGALLVENDIFWSVKNRILWQIVRSPILCMLLQDYLRTVAIRLFDEVNLNKICEYERQKFRHEVYFLAKASFFLVLFNLKEEYFKVAIKALRRLADEQEENGSFCNDILSTCLIISAMHIADIDSSRIITNQTLEWLLNEQTAQGSWNPWRLSWSYALPELGVLSTVLVLETIDLITNNEPLPIWAEESKKHVLQEKKQTRVQIDKPLPIEKEINWGDVSIYFISSESVEIRAARPFGLKNFIEMGFRDRRTGNPDLNWEALRLFAICNGEISWKDKEVDTKTRENLKSHLKVIRERLKYLFKIEDDPFYQYDRKEKSYRTKFKISIREEVQD